MLFPSAKGVSSPPWSLEWRALNTYSKAVKKWGKQLAQENMMSWKLTSKLKCSQKFGNTDALDKQRQEDTVWGLWNLGGCCVLRTTFCFMTASSAMLPIWLEKVFKRSPCSQCRLWTWSSLGSPVPSWRVWGSKQMPCETLCIWGKCPSPYYSGHQAGNDIKISGGLTADGEFLFYRLNCTPNTSTMIRCWQPLGHNNWKQMHLFARLWLNTSDDSTLISIWSALRNYDVW